jgi:hypothetical protein
VSRKLVSFLFVLTCSILAAACDPCPSCPREVVVATPTATPARTPTATVTFTPTPTPTATGTPTPSATPTGFGPASFKGAYSLRFAGKGANNGNPDDGVGILDSNGISTVTGSLTENKHGTICHFDLSGSYTVNPNGTAAINLIATPISGGCAAGAAVQASVLFNMGNGVAFVNTIGTIWLGSLTRQ